MSAPDLSPRIFVSNDDGYMADGLQALVKAAEDMDEVRVAAAIEASLLGVPAIAFSLVTRRHFDFGPSARCARQLVAAARKQRLPVNLLVNVNVPGDEPKGYAITRLGKHSYGYEVIEKE